MSTKSQETNMRRLAALLERDLGYIFGERECGPNGDKKTFLNEGKRFLRILAKDLGLRDATVSAAPGGIAASGACSLYGMWEDGGLCVYIGQITTDTEKVLCYRTIRNSKDFKGGHNHFITRNELEKWSYGQLLDVLSSLRKDGIDRERAA